MLSADRETQPHLVWYRKHWASCEPTIFYAEVMDLLDYMKSTVRGVFFPDESFAKLDAAKEKEDSFFLTPCLGQLICDSVCQGSLGGYRWAPPRSGPHCPTCFWCCDYGFQKGAELLGTQILLESVQNAPDRVFSVNKHSNPWKRAVSYRVTSLICKARRQIPEDWNVKTIANVGLI